MSAKKAPAAKKKPVAKKRTGKKRTGKNDNRWRPQANGVIFKNVLGSTVKSGVFTLWLKSGGDVTPDEIVKLQWAKHVSLSTLHKWLNGFNSGRDGTGDSNYPRMAGAHLAAIKKILAKHGAKLDPKEQKRLEKTA